jgi:hypothetical protein
MESFYFYELEPIPNPSGIFDTVCGKREKRRLITKTSGLPKLLCTHFARTKIMIVSYHNIDPDNWEPIADESTKANKCYLTPFV